MAQLSLDANAVLQHPCNHKVRVDRTETKNRWGYAGAARRIRHIRVRKSHCLQKWNNAWLAKDDVTFRFVKEESQAAPNRGSVIAKRRIGKADTRSEKTLGFVETARCTRRNRRHERTISAWHSAQLARGHVPRTD